MKVVSLDAIPVSVPYKVREASSVVNRGGVSDVLVKLTTDDGLIGWGESCKAADTAVLATAIEACRPYILGRDPWDRELIIWEAIHRGLWYLHPMLGNSVMAGIDMALWDLCGKQCQQPVYRLLGGAMRQSVNYYCYLHWGDEADVAAQCEDAARRGYSVFYLKVGVNELEEERMLRDIRQAIGPTRKLRIDANQAWSISDAIRIINRWHHMFSLDFIEAPVRIEPLDNMLDVKRAIVASLSANEGLWRESDVIRIARSRCAEYLCFSPHFVGSIRRFHTLAHVAYLEGLQVCKHTRGELGISAAAGQHVMLASPNACPGQQQNAQLLEDDILTEMVPIANGPEWGLIDNPGLGIDVDEMKVARYNENYLKAVDFGPAGDQLR